MVDRLLSVWGVVLGVLGLVVLGVLLAMRLDAGRAAATGPRWKCRLVAAALTLLGAAGVGLGRPPGPQPVRGPTCYMPIMLPERHALAALKAQLAALDKQLAAGKVSPAALGRAIDNVENAAAALAAPGARGKLSPADRKVAPALIEKARKQVAVARSWLAAKGKLADSPQWQRVAKTWKEADDVASGRRGPYPFDRKGKEALLAALETGAKDVEALVAAGQLNEPEGELLKLGLKRLAVGVRGKRPAELRMATCYDPVAFYPGRDSLLRLVGRLPLLEKLAAAERLHPAAVEKVLATVQVDLAVLGNEAHARALKPEERQTAANAAKAARAATARIRTRLRDAPKPPGDGVRPGGLTATPLWRIVVEAWRFAKPLAESHKSTTAQRKEADAKLQAAKEAIRKLVADGKITEAEGKLLVDEADAIRKEIYRDPPIDSQVNCYKMAYMAPARQSYQRLARRLPLLQAAAKGGKVSAAVLEKVLPTVRADLATLGDEAQLRKPGSPKPEQAERLRKEIAASLAAIEKSLAETR